LNIVSDFSAILIGFVVTRNDTRKGLSHPANDGSEVPVEIRSKNGGPRSGSQAMKTNQTV